jgi:hypothetical protein
VFNASLSEISLETQVSGSDPDACGDIARVKHQVSQLSSVNKRVNIYRDVTVRM